MTTQVETVQGPVDVDALGTTLMHEHVFIVDPDILRNYGEHWEEEQRIADAIAKLTAVKEAGVDTIVDPTVVGLGRYLPWVQRVNDAVDINIVAATGLYSFGELPEFFKFRGPGGLVEGPEPMTELFVRDIREGIAGTGVKAAFLKHVIEESGLTPGQERIAAAICETHQETGVPITVHTNATHQMGTVAVDFYRKHNVDLTKVVLGHSGDSNDLDYLKSLADTGATLGCDRFGLDIYNPDDQRIATVAALCKDGYADRIVLSHDVSCYLDYFPGELQTVIAQVVPNWNLLHITNNVLPALREQGVTDEQITTMMVDNPRRYFQ